MGRAVCEVLQNGIKLQHLQLEMVRRGGGIVEGGVVPWREADQRALGSHSDAANNPAHAPRREANLKSAAVAPSLYLCVFAVEQPRFSAQ